MKTKAQRPSNKRKARTRNQQSTSRKSATWMEVHAIIKIMYEVCKESSMNHRQDPFSCYKFHPNCVIFSTRETRPTSGGPPRKMVPCFRTMMLSSAMAGTYAPPAVQEPITTAIWTRQAKSPIINNGHPRLRRRCALKSMIDREIAAQGQLLWMWMQRTL